MGHTTVGKGENKKQLLLVFIKVFCEGNKTALWWGKKG